MNGLNNLELYPSSHGVIGKFILDKSEHILGLHNTKNQNFKTDTDTIVNNFYVKSYIESNFISNTQFNNGLNLFYNTTESDSRYYNYIR